MPAPGSLFQMQRGSVNVGTDYGSDDQVHHIKKKLRDFFRTTIVFLYIYSLEKKYIIDHRLEIDNSCRKY